MGLGQAIAQTMLSGTSGAAGNVLKRAQENRAAALTREGWDKQAERIKGQQDFQAGEAEKGRAYQSGEAEKGRTFQAGEAEKGRQFKRDNPGTGKGDGMKLTNTDQGTFATLGSKVYRVTQNDIIPLDIGVAEIPKGEEIVQEDGEGEESFWSKAKGFVSGYLSSGEPTSLGEAATDGDKPKLEDMQVGLEQLRDRGVGFGEIDSYIRNSGLGTLDQLQLLAMYAGGTGNEQLFPSDKNKFEGKAYSQTEYDKVKNKYPNASEQQVLESLEAFYSRAN